MSPTDRPLQTATYDHVALSVGDLEAMVGFYTRLGFDEITCVDFAPAPVHLAVLANSAGTRLELTVHDSSSPAAATGPLDAARRRGPFHFSLRVDRLIETVPRCQAAGARVVTAPALNSRGDGTFAYIADPEGNLIELVASSTVSRSRNDRRPSQPHPTTTLS
jgi:catechol 2,3-dioxygenase-like lactoylglutathione lyase family enzyme